MRETLAKTYDPDEIERKWYSFWEHQGYFRPETGKVGACYSITIPPPNVTGELHMGHALQHAIHDTVIRWKRMQGYRTLCLPGTDHAGIATQMKVEQQLFAEEKRTRHDISREEMMARIWSWKEHHGDTILQQLRDLGCSYDWSRERFTMDKRYTRAVLETFVRFHERGWIYRGRRMVNWCPRCGSVISDLEVEEKELKGHLWHIRYPGVAGAPTVVVATTRPETMLGDTAVAVHPKDGRWTEAIGKRVVLPLMDREIPIVADEYADPEMGSGAVKVTPSHDPIDYEVGQRHDLPEIQVIGRDASMTAESGRFAGQDRYACRKSVVEALKELGLLEKVTDHLHAVPHHDKCGTVIEPLPMEQWFVRMRDLAELALPALRRSEVTYVPDRFRTYSIKWLENVRDWCISRQIWWGHRIPVWTHRETGEVKIQVEPPEGLEAYEQDPDVLDTWFSSALWPFATLGWPESTEDLATFHPTDLMITDRGILYLWVTRMVMTAAEFVHEVPFRTVLVHPTVQTRDGRRMSKSLGTGIDPRELIDRYGADATRLSLLYQCGSAQDIRFDAAVVDNRLQDSPVAESCRNFCNKIWNAARFVEINLDDQVCLTPPEHLEDSADRWIMSLYHRTIESVTASLEAYRFDETARSLYEFVWNSYCDWYLEMAKVRLNGSDQQDRRRVQSVLVHVLEGTLRMAHPITPFISEELWQKLPHQGDALILAPWPVCDRARFDEIEESRMALLQGIVGAVRNIRAEMRVPPGKRVDVLLSTGSGPVATFLDAGREYIRALAKVENLKIGNRLDRPATCASAVLPDVDVYLPLEGLIDVARERDRLEKKIGKLRKVVLGLERKLGNEGFLEKAPSAIVDKERRRLEAYQTSLSKLEENLTALAFSGLED